MQKKSILVLAVVVTLLLSVVLVPIAQASTLVKVIVQNKTGQVVNVHLSGDPSYNLSFPVGVSEIYIDPGQYVFSTDSQCTGMAGRVNISRGSAWIFKCKEGQGESIFKPFQPTFIHLPFFDPTCGEDEVLEGGKCIPVEPVCDEGFVLEGGECIPVEQPSEEEMCLAEGGVWDGECFFWD